MWSGKFVCSHRHTVMRKLGEEGVKKFLASTPKFSVTSNWKDQKDGFIRYGFEAPGAVEKIKLYDSYLHKMEEVLKLGNKWLVGNRFMIADIEYPICESSCDDVNARNVGKWTVA